MRIQKLHIYVLALILIPASSFAEPISALSKYSDGVELINDGKENQAIPILRDALQENPKLTYANVLIGICFFNNGDYPSAAEEIKKYLESEINASEGGDKYPLALVYYLNCQNKLRNPQEFQKYLTLLDKYPIPNITGCVFTAQTLVDAVGNTLFQDQLRFVAYDKTILTLDKFKTKSSGVSWFNNTYGCALIVKKYPSTNSELRLNDLQSASEYFEKELSINKRAQVYLNYSVSERLRSEVYKSRFWSLLNKYKANGKLKEGYPDLKRDLILGLKCLDKAEKLKEKSKSATGHENILRKIHSNEDLINKVKNEYSLNRDIQKVLNSKD